MSVLSLGEPGDHVRATFPVMVDIPSRWSDNDMYGHLNNAVYYEFFDTAINAWVLRHVPDAGEMARGVVAESACRFYASLQFPDDVSVGLRVERLGRTSVTYRLAAFSGKDVKPHLPVAIGHWVHVYVDPVRHRPVLIPEPIRGVLSSALTHPL